MNAYNNFAGLYDRLMKQDFNYENWVDYIENIFLLNDKNPNLVCDLACGTGNITIPMSRRGYDMIGVDISTDMLDIARSKSNKAGRDILFLNQDITKLDLYGTCDAFLCMIDGFNYIIDPNKLSNLFRKIRTCFIENDGIFIFDISSKYKLSNTIGNKTFIYDSDDLFYAWENKFSERHSLSKMDLNFFVKSKSNKYKRFEEVHIQKAYQMEEIIQMLKKSGFLNVKVYDALSFDSPKDDSQRLVFVASL